MNKYPSCPTVTHHTGRGFAVLVGRHSMSSASIRLVQSQTENRKRTGPPHRCSTGHVFYFFISCFFSPSFLPEPIRTGNHRRLALRLRSFLVAAVESLLSFRHRSLSFLSPANLHRDCSFRFGLIGVGGFKSRLSRTLCTT